MVNDFVKELRRKAEILRQKQLERGNSVVDAVDSLLGLILIVKGKSYLNETKLKALRKIKKLFSKETYEYALKLYREKQTND
jgi:hypothetical protein